MSLIYKGLYQFSLKLNYEEVGLCTENTSSIKKTTGRETDRQREHAKDRFRRVCSIG